MPSPVLALSIILVVLITSLGITFFVAPITAMTGVEALIESTLSIIVWLAQTYARRRTARAKQP